MLDLMYLNLADVVLYITSICLHDSKVSKGVIVRKCFSDVVVILAILNVNILNRLTLLSN